MMIGRKGFNPYIRNKNTRGGREIGVFGSDFNHVLEPSADPGLVQWVHEVDQGGLVDDHLFERLSDPLPVLASVTAVLHLLGDICGQKE